MKQSDWHEKLWEVVREHEARPFSWTENNCCHFAFRAARAMTGIDRTYAVEAVSATDVSAMRHVISAGGLCEAISEHFGDPASGRAQRGDIVLLETPTGPVAGVWVGTGALATGEAGLVQYPRSAVPCRWEV
jgi:hypothetical protein